jgi:hypothetical protein
MVVRAVECRPRVVGHASIDDDEAPAALPLDGHDAVERRTGPRDQRAPGLDRNAVGCPARYG